MDIFSHRRKIVIKTKNTFFVHYETKANKFNFILPENTYLVIKHLKESCIASLHKAHSLRTRIYSWLWCGQVCPHSTHPHNRTGTYWNLWIVQVLPIFPIYSWKTKQWIRPYIFHFVWRAHYHHYWCGTLVVFPLQRQITSDLKSKYMLLLLLFFSVFSSFCCVRRSRCQLTYGKKSKCSRRIDWRFCVERFWISIFSQNKLKYI